jgi:type I site-specific restriction endonuclease
MATALQSLGLRADWVSGDDRDRKLKVQRLHSGEARILVNCALLTEGFDCPDVSAVVLCRPTKSRPFLAQMVGRGTRLAKGKSDCLIVDFNYLTAKHDVINPVELFDTSNTDSEVLRLAEEMARAEKGSDLLEVIERARKEHDRRQVLRVRARERDVKYRRVSYDPLAVFDTMGLPWRGPKDAVISRATEGQVKYLQTFGVEDAPNLSRTRASTLIDYLADRRRRGLATMKQCSWLIAKGIDPARARAMTKDEASARLDELFV